LQTAWQPAIQLGQSAVPLEPADSVRINSMGNSGA
jgi:hypothetical protein